MRFNNWLLSACVGLLLVWVLFSYFDIGIQEVFDAISKVGVKTLIVTIILFAAINLLRAVRFKMLLRGDISVVGLFNIVSLYILSSNILPVRTGELSYVYLIKKQSSLSGSSAMTTLVISRISDFIAISVLFLSSLFLIKNPPKTISEIFSVVGLFLIALAIMLTVLAIYHKWFIKQLRPIQQYKRIRERRVVATFLKKLENFIDHFHVLDTRTMILSALTSLVIWLVSVYMIFELLFSMGVDLNFTEVVLASSAVSLAFIVPVPTIAGVGAVEGAWSLVLISFGVPDKLAVPVSFSLHIIMIVYMILLALPGIKYVREGRK